MTGPLEPPTAQEQRALQGAMIAVPVNCCRCTYDLRGLPADGRCPECGLEVFYTLQHLVDPAASRLPRLADPVGVGNAMLWLAGCCFVAAVLLAGQSVAVWLDLVHPRQVGMYGIAIAHDLTLLAAVVGLAALWSAFKFKPSRRNDEPNIAVTLDVWMLTVGLIAWSLMTMVLWQRERSWAFSVVETDQVILTRTLIYTAMGASAVLVWFGMQRVLKTIGKRSRAYRRAHGGRQRIRPMIAATLGIILGSMLRAGHAVLGDYEELVLLGSIILWVSMLMLIIGLGYLVINAVWIRQAILHPPPQLESLLAPSD